VTAAPELWSDAGPMIQGYPEPAGVVAGDELVLHVSTTAPRFAVELYRVGAVLEAVGASERFAGVDVPRGSADADWGWPAYRIPIAADARSGAYLAVLRCFDDGGRALDEPPDLSTTLGASKLVFVVRPRTPSASILYKLPLFTYHAYNRADREPPGANLYFDSIAARDPDGPPGYKVSLRRPGGGTGALWPSDHALDAYGPPGDTERQTFEHWDAKMIGWLEREGYRVDYGTDFDLHADPHALAPYRLLVSAGHDEYWSEPLRDAIEAFVAAGGNVAFFGGNTCWWRVHVVDGGGALVCDKAGERPLDQWHNGVGRPENAITGVSYRGGGGLWFGPREPQGYQVRCASSWVFEGTGLADGDVFGADERLVGYECDGAYLDDDDRPTHGDGTPFGFQLLGLSRFTDGPLGTWEREHGAASAATMGIFCRNGTVFTAATTDWPRVLDGGEPRVVRITRNVIDRLSRRRGGQGVLAHAPAPRGDEVDAAGLAAAVAGFSSVIAIAGYRGNGDHHHHAVIATADGGLHAVEWTPGQPARRDVLPAFARATGPSDAPAPASTVTALAAHLDDHGRHHAAVTTDDGVVHDVWWTFEEAAAAFTIARVVDVDDALVAGVGRLVGQLSATAPAPSREHLAALVDSPSSLLLVARRGDGGLVGMLTLALYRIPTAHRAIVEDVVVDGAARGHGIGDALLAEAIRIAGERGATGVDLTSHPKREAANRLYLRAGFARRDTNVYRLPLRERR